MLLGINISSTLAFCSVVVPFSPSSSSSGSKEAAVHMEACVEASDKAEIPTEARRHTQIAAFSF
eukprot:11905316-Ditylum_brightwellii.AAC.1